MGKIISRDGSRGNMRDVVYQLVREMRFPFLIAAGWTAYSLFATPEKRNVIGAISIFGSSFFLACWAFSQWFRVKKQQAVESGLGGIVEKQEALLASLTEATERLEGHASGGKSFGWLMLVHARDGAVRDITAHVEGDYPLLDATASVLDLTNAGLGAEKYQRTQNVSDFFAHFVNFKFDMLQPNLGILQHKVVPCDITQPRIRFKVDWHARNGIWSQYIELKKNSDGYSFFTAVRRGGDWVFENPERDSIPKRVDGKPDVFWHTNLDETLIGRSTSKGS